MKVNHAAFCLVNGGWERHSQSAELFVPKSYLRSKHGALKKQWRPVWPWAIAIIQDRDKGSLD